jgi:hypothetical protein
MANLPPSKRPLASERQLPKELVKPVVAVAAETEKTGIVFNDWHKLNIREMFVSAEVALGNAGIVSRTSQFSNMREQVANAATLVGNAGIVFRESQPSNILTIVVTAAVLPGNAGID